MVPIGEGIGRIPISHCMSNSLSSDPILSIIGENKIVPSTDANLIECVNCICMIPSRCVFGIPFESALDIVRTRSGIMDRGMVYFGESHLSLIDSETISIRLQMNVKSIEVNSHNRTRTHTPFIYLSHFPYAHTLFSTFTLFTSRR